MAIPATGTTRAEILATRIPICQAPTAATSTSATSRSVAFAARTVRTELMARSTAAASSPTFACALRLATRIRRDSTVTTVTAMITTMSVNPSRIGSMMIMAMSAPMNVSDPPIASTSPCVNTARRSVVSLPTRETRSPVRRVSNSAMGSRSMRETSWRRDESTTPSPVRWSR